MVERKDIPQMVLQDPYLEPYTAKILGRMERVRRKIVEYTADGRALKEMALGHCYYGLHQEEKGWVLREWAPNASAIFLVGDVSNWEIRPQYSFKRINNVNWVLELPRNALHPGDPYRLFIQWEGGEGYRVPAWATCVEQDPANLVFNAVVPCSERVFDWKHPRPAVAGEAPLIYEAHIGMAGEEPRVSTFREFTRNVLPRIVKSGYNTLQLMAVMEHSYYASFGYQVSSFFAPSSRFGAPDDLKQLVDEAHGQGLRVIMDLVHSHAVKNTVEGLAQYDGTSTQFFHAGSRGDHPAWGSKCFDYAKPEVAHFLLSNCRYWLEEFRFDGFRFDGVTSMLYRDHGLSRNFTDYNDYYDGNQDEDALTYLALANKVIHDVNPCALTIAEDVSGMPGLALPLEAGGLGFDYRLSMGTPDYWIKLLKEKKDEAWDMGEMFHELTNSRVHEKCVGYAESHDQALVGDKTLAFRLMDKAMYDDMHAAHPSAIIDRGMALHKMIRLITMATAGNGYLNFMGNEFGHPEWIDFPRDGNNWSCQYARRQWSLADNPELRYRFLGAFDREMTGLVRREGLLSHRDIKRLLINNDDKVIIFSRSGLVFAFNFHPERSFPGYGFPAEKGRYRIALDSDAKEFCGFGRVDSLPDYSTVSMGDDDKNTQLKIYLPSRAALVFRRQV